VQPSGPFVWTVYVASAGLSLWSVRLKLNEAPVVAAPLRRGMSVVSENSPAPVDSATRMSIGRSAVCPPLVALTTRWYVPAFASSGRFTWRVTAGGDFGLESTLAMRKPPPWRLALQPVGTPAMATL